MLKHAIDINSTNIPSWAENYLNHCGVLTFFQILKKAKRQQTFDTWRNDEGNAITQIYKIVELSKVIYFNKKGDAVFYWASASDKTAFILKWA